MIVLQDLVLRRGAKVVLDGASVSIAPGEKVGLVGRNGAGKSSLFALLLGNLHEDKGHVQLPPSWRLAQVAQDMPETNDSATDFVVQGDTRLVAAQERLRLAEANHNQGAGQDDDDGMEIAHAHTDLIDAGVHDAPARAQALILGLGFAVDQLDAPVNSFSGGWRMRLQLARALMCPSDLLLLDEPTNHLDLDALVWLESWLNQYKGTLLVISHDTEFLDGVTRVTVHLDQAKLTRFGGNYSTFEELQGQQLSAQAAAHVRQEKQVAHLQSFIDRFKAKASKAKQAQSRVKALERLVRVGPVMGQADFSFEFKTPPALPSPMISVKEAELGYERADDQITPILHGINLSILPGQRIGILGANGQGKSTLIKTLAGSLPLLSGRITLGRGLALGYFAQQELDVLRADENPLEHFIRLAQDKGMEAKEQQLRQFLGGFAFSGDMVRQAVGQMSGGEKARLVLAMLVWQRPNLLLLDEPTNHLDMLTRQALGMALNGFEGTVLLVSHDRALLRTVCDSFWLVGRGQVKDFEGDLDEYQRYLLDEAKRLRQERQAQGKANLSARQQGTAPMTKDGSNRTLQRQFQALDVKLQALQSEKAQLEQAFHRLSNPQEMAAHGRRLKQLSEEIAPLEDQWLALSCQLGN